MIRNFFLACALFLTSCSTGSSFFGHNSLEVRSMGLERVVLQPNYTTVVCAEGFANEGDVWMTDIPMETLNAGEALNGQIAHVQVLWKPVAGKTPLSYSATNVAIEYIILTDGVVGTYSGGGFAWVTGTPETGINLTVEDATVSLEVQNPGFDDLLSPATIVGKVRSAPEQTVANQIATAVELLR